MDSDQKRGANAILQAIKKLPRYGLEWEWMTVQEKGDYLGFDEVEKIILDFLKS
jgi:hypothetical protein